MPEHSNSESKDAINILSNSKPENLDSVMTLTDISVVNSQDDFFPWELYAQRRYRPCSSCCFAFVFDESKGKIAACSSPRLHHFAEQWLTSFRVKLQCWFTSLFGDRGVAKSKALSRQVDLLQNVESLCTSFYDQKAAGVQLCLFSLQSEYAIAVHKINCHEPEFYMYN